MVRCWYINEGSLNERLECHFDPSECIDLTKLFRSTGVEYFKIDHKNYEYDEILKNLRIKRGYTYEDEITCSKECLSNFEEKLKHFFTEHLHTDEEIRFILEGTGYFDVRDENDKWIRIEVEAGDLIIIPSGIYHRFTLDDKNFIKAKRYFVGEPAWLPYNRPAENMSCRKQYLNRLKQGFE